MKADVDSIVVIILTLLFLVITGLSRRRGKKPAMRSGMQYGKPAGQEPRARDLLSDAVSMINDPFAKLEKIFNVPEQPVSQEAQSLEEIPVSGQVSYEPVAPPVAVSAEVTTGKESQSLEVIVDEVAEYMKEKEIEKSAVKTEKKIDEFDITMQEKQAFSVRDQKKKAGISLFENFDDFKKAIIYSEILKRKEYF
jgi:hypothetical protein